MAQTLSDNLKLNAPKVLDDRSGRFSSGVWRPYNNLAEFTSTQTLLSRPETLMFWVRSTTDATKADLYTLDSAKQPYKVLEQVDLSDYYTKEETDDLLDEKLNIDDVTTAINITYDDLEPDGVTYVNPILTTTAFSLNFKGIGLLQVGVHYTVISSPVKGFELINGIVFGEDDLIVLTGTFASPVEDEYSDLVSSIASKLPTAEKNAVGGVPNISDVTLRTTIAGIRAFTGTLKSNLVYTTDVGQEGNWYYDSTDTTSADNTGTILVSTDGKRFKRIYDGNIQAGWFGVVGDGVTDNATSLQSALSLSSLLTIPLELTEGTYNSTQTLSCGGLSILCSGFVTLKYTSATHIDSFLNIIPNKNIRISGKLVVDSNNKANKTLSIVNESIVIKPDIIFDELETLNARMVTGSAFNAGSGGLIVRGNFGTITGNKISAKNITRQAGTGSVSNNGCMGIEFSRNSFGAPLGIKIGTLSAHTVTTEDVVGSANCYDCDGVGIFQNDEVGAFLSVDLITGYNCQGRTLKAQCFHSSQIKQITSFRNIGGITGGATDVNVQLGEGVVSNIDITYSGLASLIHQTPTIPISFYTADVRTTGYGVMSASEITLRDYTTGAGTERIYALVDMTNGSASTQDIFGSISRLQLIGRPAKMLVSTGQNGNASVGRFNLQINGFIGSIVDAIIGGTASKAKFTCTVTGVVNTGSVVPVVYRSDGSALDFSCGLIYDGGGNFGILIQNSGNTLGGLIGTKSGVTSVLAQSVVVGFRPLYSGSITSGQTVTTDRFGAYEGTAILFMGCPNYGANGIFTTKDNTIAAITGAVGVTTSSDGLEPSALDIAVWKTDSGRKLNIKNNAGSSLDFNVFFLG